MTDNKIISAIEQSAPAGPAFGVYTDPEQEKHFAYFIDGNGRLLLLSKAYSAERYVENALQRFKEGKFTGAISETEQGWLLEIKSEGGKPIATSPAFKAEAEAAQALAALKPGEISSAERQLPVETEPVKARMPQPPSEASGLPPRYSFRLDFYKAERGAPARGRIEYSLTQESAAFHGLDMDFVRSFVARRLQEIEAPGTRKTEHKILILEDGTTSTQTVFSSNRPLGVELEVDITEQETYEAFVYAKSLEGHEQRLIGRQRGQGSPIRLNVFLGGLPGGLYRLHATVHLERSDLNHSFTSPLFHLLADTAVEAIAG